MSSPGAEFRIREATTDEVASVMGILDAAMLDMTVETVRSLGSPGGDGAVLLAIEDGRTLGALVLDGREVEAVAVRPKRRGQGVGRALIGGASERVEGDLIASFDADLRPFYEGLGFEVEPAGEAASSGGVEAADADRLWGRLSNEPR